MIDGSTWEVNKFVDWLYGKEADATYGAVSRYIQASVTRRPAAGGEAKWNDFDSLRSTNAYYGHVTSAQLEAAITAFRAS